MLSPVCSPLTKSGCLCRRCLCSRCRPLRANLKGAGMTIPWQTKTIPRPFTRSRSRRGSMIWGRGTSRRPSSTISQYLKGAPTPSGAPHFLEAQHDMHVYSSSCDMLVSSSSHDRSALLLEAQGFENISVLACVWVCGVWCVLHVCMCENLCVWCLVHACMCDSTKEKHAYSCNEPRHTRPCFLSYAYTYNVYITS